MLNRSFIWKVLPLLLCLALVEAACAQTGAQPLSAREIEIVTGVDVYGQEVLTASGQLVNEGSEAFTNISLSAAVFDEAGEQIGEGVGVLVDACGAGLLDFTLQPGRAHAFSVALDLYEADALPERVEVTPTAEALPPITPSALAEGITALVQDDEAVAVEWIDATTFRYATGCLRDPFYAWTWHTHDIEAGESSEITHPRAEAVTDELRARLLLADPLIFANAFLSFRPDGERLVYQDGVNRIYTAATDGTLIRLLHTGLNSYSLQDIHWLPGGVFLAAYFGAYGDDVIYFTADAEGRLISGSPLQSTPSVIVPGASIDGRRVVIAGTFDEVTGYYLRVVTNNFFELLFEAEPPGNNFPAPIPLLGPTPGDPTTDRVAQVYVALPTEDGGARLACFNRDEGVLHDLAALPLRLDTGARAWWWLAPDGYGLGVDNAQATAEPTPDTAASRGHIALAATGVEGGLWLIDLDQLPPCASE